ncbi:type II toxin-antitoxin system RelE/ParE family toxin [Caulobacter zeae]|uniref:type II toxin-antitoxin system RelE/ParE family toxin n=1 Tax=Caulobacter zeae TaxID=2055137 RepID=UPI0013FE2925|nr:type II toxin-antitoxin system RelE/ParE family toxin [Caulobacter zeae]
MAEVVWTDRALADIEAIVAYIVGQHSPIAAQRLAQRLLTTGDTLATNHDRGRPIKRGRRELAIVPPYLIRYRIKAEQVLILEVRHGARRPD